MDETELYDRGLEDFESLSPLERKVFLEQHFQICCYMDGFTSFFFQGGHSDKVDEVVDFLREVQDFVSANAASEGFRIWSTIEEEMKKYEDPYDYECTPEGIALEEQLDSFAKEFDENISQRAELIQNYLKKNEGA